MSQAEEPRGSAERAEPASSGGIGLRVKTVRVADTALPSTPLEPVIPEPGDDARVGIRIGNLRLINRIGTGGMGDVYRARHEALRTWFAVKVLHPRFSEDRDTVERFRREAVACSRLRNEHVVFVTDFGFDADIGIYIVMELLEGLTLKDALRRSGPMGVGRLARVGMQLCTAMAAAHRHGIFHRDLKPENIMLLSDRPDFVKVLDFGIAFMKDREVSGEQLRQGEILGTPQYMAPEQVINKAEYIGPHTDIYAMGLIFYAMLTGRPPFTGGDEVSVLTRQVNEPAPRLGATLPELAGTRLEGLIAQMLAKGIKDRPQSAHEVAQSLEDALLELQVKGVEGAVYVPPDAVNQDDTPTLDTAGGGRVTRNSHTIRMTQVLRQIRTVNPQSPVGVLLNALPDLEGLRGEAMLLALWGVLQPELMEAEPGSDELEVLAVQVAILVHAVLASHDGDEVSSTQHRVFRAISAYIGLLPPATRQVLLKGLRPLSAHPHFPASLLADEYTGNWDALKGLMTKEIHLTWPGGGAPRPQVADAELAAMSLVEKLQQDVSLRVLGSVLKHELRFGRRREPEKEE
ncbi:MAG: serine/threonine protein kinase [Alphaproteobacteria bacterium]|nr:serine/threonine protein kinase [Alphaproteobacteria bacterium]